MKTLLSVVIMALQAACLAEGDPAESSYYRRTIGWFYDHVALGQSAKDLGFLWERYDSSPIRMTGAQIRKRVRELSAVNGIKEDFLPSALRDDSTYWFWSQQGPMSDREMFIILAGEKADSAIVVFATIEERLCL